MSICYCLMSLATHVKISNVTAQLFFVTIASVHLAQKQLQENFYSYYLLN